MSRIGKRPVVIEKGLTVKLDAGNLTMKGPKGELKLAVGEDRYPLVKVTVAPESISVARISDSRESRMQQGLVRALIHNMATGVAHGFKKELDVVGVGYKAEVKGKLLNINAGFSHVVEFPIPNGITVTVEKQARITIVGADRKLVGETAASIRRVRPPEPYKGKGIRYAGEYVRRKVGKAAAGTTGGA
jgi:large subunit ribosomal protein L6